MKMKKLTSLLLASVMVLSMLAGCGNKADAPNSEPPASNPPASQPADDNKEPAPAGKEHDGVTHVVHVVLRRAPGQRDLRGRRRF